MTSVSAVRRVLILHHLEHSNPAMFRIQRAGEGLSLAVLPVPSPYDAPVRNRPSSNLMRRLRWYLEHYLEYPRHPETANAADVMDALKTWGSIAFQTLFDTVEATAWYANADIIRIESNDPAVLSWPWEALCDSQGRYLAVLRKVERGLTRIAQFPAPLAPASGRINILLVVARPYVSDIGYRTLAGPLVDLMSSSPLPVRVDVLRPPTFDRLCRRLENKPGFYHVIHFDGHGGFRGDDSGTKGCLTFEDTEGQPDDRSAHDIGTLLRQHPVPLVLLNACHSGKLDINAEDVFASVATSLLVNGVRSVVAMSYALTVTGARVFLPAFYARLFTTGNPGDATLAGRQAMLSNQNRRGAGGPGLLEDWMLPVLYQQENADFQAALSFRESSDTEPHARHSNLPPEVLKHKERYGFIGRDSAIQAMERALLHRTPALLLFGLAGIGKTSLAREFLRWRDRTGGLDTPACWLDFQTIRTAEYVINSLCEVYCKGQLTSKSLTARLEMLIAALRSAHTLVVWDNFESAQRNLVKTERLLLSRLLDGVQGGRTKILIMSRDREAWLGASRLFEVPVGALPWEERWEYCEALLTERQIEVNRDDQDLAVLLEQLGGHPLAMRAVLPHLEQQSLPDLIQRLHIQLAHSIESDDPDESRLFGALRFVEQELSKDLRPLLKLVGLHERYLDAEYVETMARLISARWTREKIDRLLAQLATAGLVHDRGHAQFELHPLLSTYLGSRPRSRRIQRAFVIVMGSLADDIAQRALHVQQYALFVHGASLERACAFARPVGLPEDYAAVMQVLAQRAFIDRAFGEATQLLNELAHFGQERKLPRIESAALHQLGMVAEEQRELDLASTWYLKSLEIDEKHSTVVEAAKTYHQLGCIALEKRDFSAAREWHLKALSIDESHGNADSIAKSCHQLGRVAEEQGDLAEAGQWYLKSLETRNEEDLVGRAKTLHQLGLLAQEQQDFKTARDWYLQSLQIKQRFGDQEGAAVSCHQLGMVAQELEDVEQARDWYIRSLAISEHHDLRAVACLTYHQLGMIAEDQGDVVTSREWYMKSLAIAQSLEDFHSIAITELQLGRIAADSVEAARWEAQAIRGFRDSADPGRAEKALHNFLVTYRNATATERPALEALWNESGLGPFPHGQVTKPRS